MKNAAVHIIAIAVLSGSPIDLDLLIEYRLFNEIFQMLNVKNEKTLILILQGIEKIFLKFQS